MPCEVQWEGRWLRARLVGLITEADLLALQATFSRIEAECEVIPNRLVDLRNMTTSAATSDAVREFATARRQQKFPNAFRTAIVTDNTLQLGYARMFQIVNDNPAITMRIFTEEIAAREWVAES